MPACLPAAEVGPGDDARSALSACCEDVSNRAPRRAVLGDHGVDQGGGDRGAEAYAAAGGVAAASALVVVSVSAPAPGGAVRAEVIVGQRDGASREGQAAAAASGTCAAGSGVG